MSSKEFKIVHIIPTLESGGAERMLTRTVSENEDTQHVVISLTEQGMFGASVRSTGARLITLGMNKDIASVFKVFTLAKHLRAERPDAIVTWLYHADLMGTFATLLSGTSFKKLFWNVRCSNLDLSRYRWTTKAVQKFLTVFSRFPNAIISNSRAGIKAHREIGYKAKKWIYFPNGIDHLECERKDHYRSQTRSVLNIPNDAFIFGFIARVDPMKNHDSLLRAAEQLLNERDNTYFVLIGRGTQNLKFPEILRPKIICLGERQDIHQLIQSFDITLLCSKFGEGFPNVLMESMANGIPCISTDVGDAAYVLGDTGWLIEPNNDDLLLQTLRKVRDMSEQDLQLRSELSRQRIANNFHLKKITCDFFNNLKNAVK